MFWKIDMVNWNIIYYIEYFVEKILQESENIFADTLEEFCSLEVITKRFDDWRVKEKDSYREAYIEMFLPRLSSCIIRVQFLQAAWNPLEHEANFIKKSTWFQILTEYDLRSDVNYDSRPKEVNNLVISKTIEMVVVPYIVEVFLFVQINLILVLL